MKKLLILLAAVLFGVTSYAQSLDEAQKAIEAEQYEKARNILEALVNKNPADGQYNFHLGGLFLTLGEDALAKQAFEKGVAAEKNGVINNIGLGWILLNEGKQAEAAAAFNKATEKIKKKDTDEWLYIARAYLRSYNPDYNKAVEYAQKAVTINPNLAQGFLTLGDAQFNLDNMNEAYSAYRTAFTLDNTLLRAKLHLALITKNARAFPEAVLELNEIIALNPNYGPVYRELAEVHYLWATLDADVHDEYIAKALKYYEQYMTLTDYSLDSRMRHADFLVLAKDYESLEKEAAEMQKIDKVNPRILRYLGYSAYENGNYADAAKAISDFLKVVEPRRVLGIDYVYLAKSEAKMLEADTTVDPAKLDKMLTSLSEAIKMESPLDPEFNELGVKYYKAQDWGNAAKVFGTLSSRSDAGLLDRLYYGNAIFYNAAGMDSLAQAAYIPEMMKADSVYALVIEGSPTTQDTYFNRARLNRYIPGAEAKTAELFQQYIDVATEKGEAELAKPTTRKRISEAYTSIGAYYSDLDVPKAIGNFEKAIELDSTNQHAIYSLEFLKQKK